MRRWRTCAAQFALQSGYRKATSVTASDQRAERRRAAFAEAFGLAPVPDVSVGGSASIVAGRQGLARLFEAGDPRGRVIFCSSDIIAHGILIEARARGLSVPKDIAVMGFGDQEFAEFLDPPLTSVRIDREQLGQIAADKILNRIAGRDIPSSVTSLDFQIVDRSTV